MKDYDKLEYKCFKYHKIGHFKKDYPEWEGNDDFGQFVVALEDYENAGALVDSSLEEDGVSHLENFDTCKLNIIKNG